MSIEAGAEGCPHAGNSARRGLIRLLVAAAGLYGWALGSRPLYAPDEGRYALVGRTMLDGGDWLIPRLCGAPYLDKPPLLYWLEAAGMAVLGRNEWGARALVACAALAGVAVMYRLAADMMDSRRGLVAAGVLATSALYALLARVILTDMLLAVAVLGSFAGFWRGWQGRRGVLGMWISLGIAFLAKGPVGPALFILAVVPFAVLARTRPPLRTFRPVTGTLIAAAIALPWTIYISLKVPGYLEFFYLRENLQGLASGGVHHDRAWTYAAYAVLGGFLPWTLLLPAALTSAWSDLRERGRACDPALLLALLWAGTTLALFTFSVSKLPAYFLPAFPALALLVARPFRAGEEPRRQAAYALYALAGLVPAGICVAARLDDRLQTCGWLALASLVAACGFAVAGALFRRGLPAGAVQVVAAGLAVAAIPAALDVPRFDSTRSSKTLVLRNADLLRSCDTILSLRSPLGMIEFYLDRPVVHVGVPHDFISARETGSGGVLSIERSEIPAFLRENPRTALLTTDRGRRRREAEIPGLVVVDTDGTNTLLATPGALR
ncbi:MAG: glycosyltransferase family 39 protein [Planctomycetes bacterium]|nr:glycosyltransferase family 39 protein [Planctomycetota bacterium]